MSEILKCDDIFQTILDRLIILKNEINVSIQTNTTQEMENCIDSNFDLLYHDIKYQINKIYKVANIENMRLLKELRKARQIIQLQTCSSVITNKISQIIEKDENDKS